MIEWELDEWVEHVNDCNCTSTMEASSHLTAAIYFEKDPRCVTKTRYIKNETVTTIYDIMPEDDE